MVSEALPTAIRGYGTTIVASFGILGAILASNIAQRFDWRMAYFIGGALGIALLILRIVQALSKNQNRRRPAWRSLLAVLVVEESGKYLGCIAVGVPIWFVIGILITFSPEFSKELGIRGVVNAGQAVMYAYMGCAVGGLASGLLSQYFKSRKKVVALFLKISLALVLIFLNARGVDASVFYLICAALGFSTGYWALFVTIGAEQFGTNLRATAATTTPNFVRGAVVPLTFLFTWARGSFKINSAALLVGGATIAVAYLALQSLRKRSTRIWNTSTTDGRLRSSSLALSGPVS